MRAFCSRSFILKADEFACRSLVVDRCTSRRHHHHRILRRYVKPTLSTAAACLTLFIRCIQTTSSIQLMRRARSGASPSPLSVSSSFL